MYNINNFISTKETYHEPCNRATVQPCNRATVQPCNRATNTGNKLNALLAALALVAATLATPSAYAYIAIIGGQVNSTHPTRAYYIGVADNRADAIEHAQERCESDKTELAFDNSFLVCSSEDEGGENYEEGYAVSGTDSACVAAAISSTSGDLAGVFRLAGTGQAALDLAEGDCEGLAADNSCNIINLITSGTDANGDMTGMPNVNYENFHHTTAQGGTDNVCDTLGLICEDDELPNIADGSCDECPTNTHVVVGGICEPIAECDADRQILNQTENECETCDFDKSPQNNECVCTDENTLDVEGTCTRILECIGNQIRDPEMPTECMNCGDKTANEERNLCEAACTGDNEIKDGEGDCRTCESDSIPNEENTECLPNCSNHDEYKDSDGYCVQCNTGLVASDNNDSCVAVPAVKTPSSKTGVVLGLVVLGVYAANVFAAPAAESVAINWTPSYAFRNNNGNISYSVGSRWTARTDNWRYYWQTTQSGGKFSYGSGMNYNTGIFAATMDSESDSDMTDLDISLSATKALGLWHFNGGYNLDAQLSPTEKTEMQNRLNIAARYSLDKWILSATANTDGEKAAARINYSYRF